jgi:hypothetical protein
MGYFFQGPAPESLEKELTAPVIDVPDTDGDISAMMQHLGTPGTYAPPIEKAISYASIRKVTEAPLELPATWTPTVTLKPEPNSPLGKADPDSLSARFKAWQAGL